MRKLEIVYVFSKVSLDKTLHVRLLEETEDSNAKIDCMDIIGTNLKFRVGDQKGAPLYEDGKVAVFLNQQAWVHWLESKDNAG